jgi:hypothetical protein
MTPGQLQRLDTLIPEARQAFDQLIAAMIARGLTPYVGQCRRTPDQQAQAIHDGTTSKRQTISWHELGRAVDFRALLPDGTPDQTTHNEPFFKALYEEATKIDGLRSLAYHLDGSKLLLNGKTWDAGHVEFRQPYETLAEAVQAEAPELAA